jgi:hypothetical protein
MREFREINDGAPLSVDIRPKTRADEERLGKGPGKLQTEDPMLRVRTDQATGDVVIAGTGELDLEIILDSVGRGIDLVDPSRRIWVEGTTHAPKRDHSIRSAR